MCPDETRAPHGKGPPSRLVYHEGKILNWQAADGKRDPELRIQCLVDGIVVSVIPQDLESSVFLAARHPGIKGRRLFDFGLPRGLEVDFPLGTKWTPVLEKKGAHCMVSGRSYTALDQRYMKCIERAIKGAGFRLLNIGIQALRTNLKPIEGFDLPPEEENQAAHKDAAGFAHVRGIPTEVKSAIENHALVLIAPLVGKGESPRDYLIGTTAKVVHPVVVMRSLCVDGGECWRVLVLSPTHPLLA